MPLQHVLQIKIIIELNFYLSFKISLTKTIIFKRKQILTGRNVGKMFFFKYFYTCLFPNNLTRRQNQKLLVWFRARISIFKISEGFVINGRKHTNCRLLMEGIYVLLSCMVIYINLYSIVGNSPFRGNAP